MPTSLSQNIYLGDLHRLSRNQLKRARSTQSRQSSSSPSSSSLSSSSRSSTSSSSSSFSSSLMLHSSYDNSLDFSSDEDCSEGESTNPHDLLIHALIERHQQEDREAVLGASAAATPRRALGDPEAVRRLDEDATPAQHAHLTAKPKSCNVEASVCQSPSKSHENGNSSEFNESSRSDSRTNRQKYSNLTLTTQ